MQFELRPDIQYDSFVFAVLQVRLEYAAPDSPRYTLGQHVLQVVPPRNFRQQMLVSHMYLQVLISRLSLDNAPYTGHGASFESAWRNRLCVSYVSTASQSCRCCVDCLCMTANRGLEKYCSGSARIWKGGCDMLLERSFAFRQGLAHAHVCLPASSRYTTRL